MERVRRTREREGARGGNESAHVHMRTRQGGGRVTLAFSEYLRLFYVCVQAPPNVIKMFDAP